MLLIETRGRSRARKVGLQQSLAERLEHGISISIKKPNKRFSIGAEARKKRVSDCLKNIWTVQYTFTKLYGVNPEIVISNQTPFQGISSNENMNFKGSPQTTYLKENHSLSRERVTAMTSLSSEKASSAPKLEFVFKGVSTRVKVNPLTGVTVQWAPKGCYRLEHMVKFCNQTPVQSCALFPQKRKIFTLDDYSAHLDPQIKEVLKKQGYFLVILPECITGDL